MAHAPALDVRPTVSARPALLAAELRVALMRSARRLRVERSSSCITDGQYSVLALLEHHGESTPRELADLERVQPPSMTRTLNALGEAGLVVRTLNPADRRQVLIAATEAGAREVKETRRRRDQWLTQRLTALSPADRDVLARATEILRELVAR